ncbi:MAG: hypothetical protein ACRD12_14395 [Acidimicrobiales bacterium]
MSMRDSFRAGYIPSLAGRYFNGVQLLTEASRGAGVDLARVIGTEREAVVGRRDEAFALLDEADRLQRAVGVVPLERAEGAAGYAEWSEGVFATVGAALGPGSPEAVAHLLGYVLGEAVATLDAIAILSRLRAVTPDHMRMRVQGDSLERERQTAERRLGRLAAHDLLPEEVRTAAALAAHRVFEHAAGLVEEQAAVIQSSFL